MSRATSESSPAAAESTTVPDHETYDPAFFAELAQAEDRHFWFRARNQVIGALVQQIARDLPSGHAVLEVGCGTGNTLRVLEEHCSAGRVVGLDLYSEGLRIARTRTGCLLVRGDLTSLPFSGGFDLVGCFDVLEHISDDEDVLRHLHSALAPGGALLVTVPAGRSLWSYFDVASRHCRRYEASELADKLAQAGFRVEYLTPYMMSIFPLVWLGRRIAARGTRTQGDQSAHAHQLASVELKVNPLLNEPLAALLALEVRLIAARRRLPFGTSLLAIARKETGRSSP